MRKPLDGILQQEWIDFIIVINNMFTLTTITINNLNTTNIIKLCSMAIK